MGVEKVLRTPASVDLTIEELHGDGNPFDVGCQEMAAAVDEQTDFFPFLDRLARNKATSVGTAGSFVIPCFVAKVTHNFQDASYFFLVDAATEAPRRFDNSSRSDSRSSPSPIILFPRTRKTLYVKYY